jgi:hypothetical protein
MLHKNLRALYCKELEITRVTLYKYVSPTGELRDYAKIVLGIEKNLRS